MILTPPNPILLLLVVSISSSISIISSTARELRPSYHGLSNQTDPPTSSTDQMKSFFDSTTPGSDSLALPKPTDSSDSDWWKRGQNESRRRKRRRGLVKRILLITSIVCGIAGAAFLLAAAAVFAFRFRKNGGANEAAGPSRSAQLVVK